MRDTRRTASACIAKLEAASELIGDVADHYRWDEAGCHDLDEIQDLIGYLIEYAQGGKMTSEKENHGY